MIATRVEKLKFLVEEMQIAMQLALRSTDAFVSRTLARHVLVRAENFIAHARQLRKPLNNAGYATGKFHEWKETYARAFDEYFQLSRDRLGAHVQDFDFGKRLELWNDIEIIKIGYFVDGAAEIYAELASMSLPGYDPYTSPSELADPAFEDFLTRVATQDDGRQWMEVGTDPLAMTRDNTSAILNLSPIHQRAAQLALIRRWMSIQHRMLNEAPGLVGTTRVIKARLVTDIVSFCDCLVTREVQAGAPQEMEGLDHLIVASGESDASITAFTTASNFNRELASIRQTRDKMGGHLEIDVAYTIQSLLHDLDHLDMAAIMEFYQGLEAVFLKVCHNILFLRMHAADGRRLYGITPVTKPSVPFAGLASNLVTEPLPPPVNDESAYEEFLMQWLDGDENSKGDARQFFWNAFMVSEVLEEIHEEKGVYRLSGISEHEFRKVHGFITSRLSTPISDPDFKNILTLLETCRGGAPYPLAEILVRYGRTTPPSLRQWMVCRSLGKIATLPHVSVSTFLKEKSNRDPWRIRLDAILASFKIFIRTEEPYRFNHRNQQAIEFMDYVSALTKGMARPERLVCSLGFASALNAADSGAGSQPFAADYARLQADIETLCLDYLKDAVGSGKVDTLKKLIQTHDYVGVCVHLAIDLQEQSPRPLFEALIDACCVNSIQTVGHNQSVRHLAMCFLLAKDYAGALRVAQNLAIRNPDLIEYQILVAQILAQKPGSEEEALERIRSVRRFYKTSVQDEALLAAAEQAANARKVSSL